MDEDETLMISLLFLMTLHFRSGLALYKKYILLTRSYVIFFFFKNSGFGNRWCKREYVEPDVLKEWKVRIFNIVDQRIKFYSQNTNLLPPKPKSTFRHLKQGIQDFHRKYVLVPADKAANNVVIV